MLMQVGQRFVASGNEADWEALWQEMTVIAQQEDGFLSARLLRSREHKSKYTLIYVWERESSWNTYFHRPEIQELMQRSYRLFSGPPIQEWFDLIAELPAGEGAAAGR